jgi:cation transport regulator ChaC
VARVDLWYFGYGSNLHRSIFFDRRGMRPLDVRRGRVEGYVLRFNLPVGPGERAVANVEAQAGAYTWGVAYLLRPEECERLDRSEGVPAGIYQRVPVEILVDGDERLPGFTYRSSRVTDGRKPSARYMGLILEGARAHTLPDEWIAWLEGFELAVDEREPATRP